MDTHEMKSWLLDDNETAREWRTNPENQKQVGAMVETLASSAGGLSRSYVETRLAEERRKMENEKATEEAGKRRLKELYESKRGKSLVMGVSAHDFEHAWPGMLADMMTKGTLAQEFEKVAQAKRAQAARTF